MFTKEQGLRMAMPEMTDFFQKQAQECRRLAAQASGKNDREYWFRLAQRWEWLAQQNVTAKVKTARPTNRSRKAICKATSRLVQQRFTAKKRKRLPAALSHYLPWDGKSRVRGLENATGRLSGRPVFTG
jgi:hypothetical protein